MSRCTIRKLRCLFTKLKKTANRNKLLIEILVKQKIVELFLINNADISMKNNEGQVPKEMTIDSSIRKLLEGMFNVVFPCLIYTTFY